MDYTIFFYYLIKKEVKSTLFYLRQNLKLFSPFILADVIQVKVMYSHFLKYLKAKDLLETL